MRTDCAGLPFASATPSLPRYQAAVDEHAGQHGGDEHQLCPAETDPAADDDETAEASRDDKPPQR